MAYQTHNWTSGEAITQEKLNNIHEGIDSALNGIGQRYTKSEIDAKVSTINSSIANAQETANNALSTANTAELHTQAGNDAWTQVAGAITIDPETGLVTKNLATRLTEDESNIQSASSNIQLLNNEIVTARGTLVHTGNNATASNLKAKLDDIDSQVQINKGAISTAQQDYINAKGTYNTLQARLDNADTQFGTLQSEIQTARDDEASLNARLNAIDNSTRPSRNLPNVITEINNAHRSSNDTLDARFDSIDGGSAPSRSLPDVIGEINDAHRAGVTGDSLNQRFNSIGTDISTINTALGSGFNSTNTVSAAITAAEQAAKDYTDAKNTQNNVAEINNAHRQNGDTLDSRFEDIEDRLDDIDNPESGSVSLLQEEVGNAHRTSEDTLDERFDDIEHTISHTASGADVGGLTERIEAVESEIDDARGSKANLDARLDDIDSNISGVAGRVSTIEGDLNTASTGLKAKVSALENTINDEETGLAAVKAIADNAASATAVSNLASRVTTLEGKDTIIVSRPVSGSNYTNNVPNLQNPSADADYLIQADDNKYYYWRYINSTWHLISGASEGGSSGGNNSGYDYADEASYNSVAKAENTDYYVTKADGVHHYRYVTINNVLTEIEIGEIINKENIKKYNIKKRDTTITRDGQQVDVTYLDLYQYDFGVSNDDFDTTSTGVNLLTSVELPKGGGISGASQDVTRITPRNLTQALNSGDALEVKFFYTSGAANEGAHYTLVQTDPSNVTTTLLSNIAITSGDPATASSTWPTKTVSGETVPVASGEVAGFYSIDLASYCSSIGTHTFEVIITDDETEASINRKWDVNVINLNINSTFSEGTIVDSGSSVQFTYIPEGGIDKTVHFEIDGTEIGTVVVYATSSGVEQTYTIPAQSNGAHRLKVYMTAQITGRVDPLTSDAIYRDLIWRDASSSDVIISSPYRGQTTNATQYDTIIIPYTVAGGLTNSYTVEYYVDSGVTPVNTTTLQNVNSGEWTYVATINNTENNTETHVLTIKVGSAQISTTIVVEKLRMDLAPVTTNLAIDFDPLGMNNSSQQNREWTNGTYSLTTSSNFDWFNGGYGADETGSYFLIKAGTRAYFDYKMFENYTQEVSQNVYQIKSKAFRDGAEMKIIFKTAGVRRADAVWFSNMGKPDTELDTEVGIQLNVHDGWLKTDAVSAGTEEVAATNTYLYFPYSEEDKIELDININAAGSAATNFFMSYEDGVPSKAYAYTEAEKLYHATNHESIITIGSDDCDVYIYRFKVYTGELSTEQVLRNFIADGKDVEERRARYNRNAIYWDTVQNAYVPYKSASASLDPERLAQRLPDVKILMLETPQFTENKKDFIPYTTLRCIHAPGGTVYPSRGAADNWFFENGYHAGQGTTSDKYGDAGRNIDFLFNCDGIHKPSDKVKAISGYVSKVTTGYGTPEATTSTVTDWKGDGGKVSLTSTSIPNNFFNFKVNIASSENVNNALLQKRYNDFLPYLSPAKKRDNRVKNDMEFVPAILFLRETGITDPDGAASPVARREFNDDQWHFYALGNLGDSKKTDYTRAYDPTDMNEFTVEITDNNTNNSQFQTGMYYNSNNELVYEPYITEEQFDDDNKSIGIGAVSTASPAILTNNYAYPISKAQWTATDGQGNPLNMRYWSLMNEPFDGKHSFEMRYACKGDYRDGKVVNDTTGQAAAQLALNTRVWQAFYTWVVTSDNATFESELDQWCVKSAVEFFYAFTHYYTMMDNRAKNTFWHFAKTGIHRRVTSPVPELLHIYEVAVGDVTQPDVNENAYEGTFEPTTDNAINPAHTYYTQYGFDIWDYDNDTALGIDNNGELVFPYGREDSDYRILGNAASGFVFNGAGSVFWKRLRDEFTSEIRNIFTSVNNECFSADNLITQFDRYQNCYPESIWRLDVERKYIRPFKGTAEDNSIPRTNTRFLKSMMQGRKKYHRRQWTRNQGVYFGSKYMLSSVANNIFTMDCYTPAEQAIPANYNVTITPYQDMYINVTYGGTPVSAKRAVAGQPIEIVSPLATMDNTRIYIYGSNYIQGLAGKAIYNANDEIIGANGLAALYFGHNDFSHNNKLRELNIGTTNTNYRNANLTELNLSATNPILETLNIQNCGSLSGILNLSQSTNLKTIEAQGTNLSQIQLPSSTGIETLHLPSSINTLNLQSAKLLDELTITDRDGTANVSNLTVLNINDSDYSTNVDWIDIATDAINHLSTMYLMNLNSASITNISELEVFAVRRNEISNPNLIGLSGTLTVTGDWSEIEKTTYESIWNDLTLNTNPANVQTKWKVTYKLNETDTDDDALYTMYVNDGSTIIDIWYNHLISTEPSKAATAEYTYSFGAKNQSGQYIRWSGWRRSNSSVSIEDERAVKGTAVTGNLVLIAVFKGESRVYPVKWFMHEGDTTPVATSQTVSYGGGHNLEAPTVKDIHDAGFVTSTVTIHNTNPKTVSYEIFTGWDKLPIDIHPLATDTSFNIYATWSRGTNIALTAMLNNLDNPSPEQLAVLAALEDNERPNYLEVNDRFSCTMGYDGTEEGRLLIGEGATETMTTDVGEQRSGYTIARFDNAMSMDPFEANISPLAAGDDAFTLAIDYSFAENASYGASVKEAVLASCYSNNGGTVAGFKLFYNLDTSSQSGTVPVGPRVSFGDTRSAGNLAAYSVPVGNAFTAKYRNIIVLRHPKNDPLLYIYSGVNNSNDILGSLDEANFVQTIEWSNVSTNAKLTFGKLALNSSSTEMVGAQGTIYWAKYWNKDLGAGECKQLAAWCHEKMTYALEEYAGMQEDRFVFTQVANRPNLVFTSMNASQYGHVAMRAQRSTGDTLGWSTSTLRSIANNRIMLGLPIKLQAVISKSPVQSKTATYVNIDYNNYYVVSGDPVVTSDYIFMPSAIELGNTNTATYGAEASGKMKWLNTTPLVVRKYSNGSTTWPEYNNATNASYMNLRFPIYPLKAGERSNNVYIGYTPSTSIYTSINSTIGIQRGDIFIDQSDNAYIYVTAADVQAGAPIVIDAAGLYSCSTGGWVKAEPWWTRTVFDQNSYYVTFMYVNTTGTLITSASNDFTYDGYGFNYSFSI